MKQEIHLRDDQPESTEQRIVRRLKPSNDGLTADTHVVQGSPISATRVHHTVHFSGNQRKHSRGEGGAR